MNRLFRYTPLSLSILFVISAGYFYFFGNYLFFFQENQSLFVYSGEYLQQFLVKPGGLLEYAGNFLTQVYYNYLYGSIILGLLFTLLSVVFLQINKRLSPDRTYSLFFIILPACLLLLLQTNFSLPIDNNLGFLFAALYFLLTISRNKKIYLILALAFFPVFYYIAGAYAWIYLGMYLIYGSVYEKKIYPVLLLVISIVSFFLFRDFLFLQPVEKLLFYPLPVKDSFIHPVYYYLVSGFIILYPLLIKTCYSVKIQINKAGTISLSLVAAVFIITVFSLTRLYNRDTANLLKLEKMVIAQDWEGVIKTQETCQLSNLIAEYYYNLALAEKGLLCERMFFGRQDFRTRSLIIPWDSQAGINNIFRGVYFFYAIGMINEAHRWAFESMVMQGYRPENVKLLIKTNLINGHFKIAEKYINVLKKTWHYRKWAEKYESMLNNPESIKSNPELGEKIRIRPVADFSIRIKNPQTNIPALLMSNPGNEKAFDYKMAWYLLEKNIGAILRELQNMKNVVYKKLPRHIEEAVLVFTSNAGPVRNVGNYKVSSETELRFLRYESTVKPFSGKKASGEIQKAFGNTYWFYLDFK